MLKINFIIKIFNRLSKKFILIEVIKLSNKTKYIITTIVWKKILKSGECKIFKGDIREEMKKIHTNKTNEHKNNLFDRINNFFDKILYKIW